MSRFSCYKGSGYRGCDHRVIELQKMIFLQGVHFIRITATIPDQTEDAGQQL